MIPEGAVEAAARYMHDFEGYFELFENAPDYRREEFCEKARSILECAAPYIKAQAIDKAAEDAEGLGMEEIPVHSLRFRAHCYRNIADNLCGGKG